MAESVPNTEISSPAEPGSSMPGADYEIVRDLAARFGADALVFQPTKDDVPTLWVKRGQVIEVLRYLRSVPRPYVMLYDLSAMDERMRKHRNGLPAADFTVFYHLLSIERNSDVRIKVALSSDDLSIPTAV
jgi:NADH-quinone oxidoreductase subunit C/D